MAIGCGRNGLRDWCVQRISAVIILAYVILLASYFVVHHKADYLSWCDFFQSNTVRYFSLFCLFFTVWHAWIGLWTVMTDYIKPLLLRLFCFAGVFGLLAGCLAWGAYLFLN